MIRQVVHVSEAEVDVRTGMGRVASEWKAAFERRGIEFIHFGPGRVAGAGHRAVWHRAAARAVATAGLRPDWVLAHEPVGHACVRLGFPTIVFSHGLERRGAAILDRPAPSPAGWPARLKARALETLLWSWRRRQCDLGLRSCRLALVSNGADADFMRTYYGRSGENIHIFSNGVDPVDIPPIDSRADRQALFYGSWIPRKGTAALVEAVSRLRHRGVDLKVLVASGSDGASGGAARWPAILDATFENVPTIDRRDEGALFARAGIFILPSWFEGQPLTLLQAMAYGRCCIASEIPGHLELIRDGWNGFLFPPGDAAGLAACLEKCLASPDLCRRMGLRAAESVAGRSWPTVSDRLVDRILAIPSAAG